MTQTGDSECRSGSSSGQAESRPNQSSWFVTDEAAQSTGTSPDGVNGPPQALGGSAGSKPKFLKLGTFNGSTPLEACLIKLQGCTKYNAWSAEDRVCHIIAGLEGPAQQVLYDVNDSTTDTELINILKNRFGNAKKVEQHRAALRARRMKPGESLQDLYVDMKYLMSLAYAGERGVVCESLAKDMFLDAMDNPQLRQRVLDQQPNNID